MTERRKLYKDQEQECSTQKKQEGHNIQDKTEVKCLRKSMNSVLEQNGKRGGRSSQDQNIWKELNHTGCIKPELVIKNLFFKI